jgi:DNA modification methylase
MKREWHRGLELTWPGKRAPGAARRASAPRLVTLEEAGDPAADGFRNKLIRADNRLAIPALLEHFAGKVDLVYIDPPFATGGDFSLAAGGAEVLAYSDRWRSGLGDYLSTMLEQLELIRALLSERGTIFVHCDWHVSHHLRCLLDEVFGPDAFKNEIVWRYRRWPARTRVFQRMHDVLFWYGLSAGDGHAWTPLYEELAPSTLETWGTKRQIADFSTGRRKPSQTDEETPGAPMSDVWDIGIIAPIARERVGYPTQKPEALLRRVIEAASRPGDLVADLFAGSGTTLAVAEKLGRRWIGCDDGRAAIHMSRKRLLGLKATRPGEVFERGCSAFEILAAEGEGEARPAPEVAIAAVASGTGKKARRTVKLSLGGDADAVDFWAVDWDHDGRVFRGSWHASREMRRKKGMPLSVEHAYDTPGAHRIAVQIAGAGGDERRIELTWDAGDAPR